MRFLLARPAFHRTRCIADHVVGVMPLMPRQSTQLPASAPVCSCYCRLAAGSTRHTTYTYIGAVTSKQNITVVQMASHYEQFFREADKDGSGFLTVDELIKLLRDKGYKESDDKIRVRRSAA